MQLNTVNNCFCKIAAHYIFDMDQDMHKDIFMLHIVTAILSVTAFVFD